ncbi:MAG: hypothetical protein ACREKM_10630 [Longimicrobiales bacterium]
MANDKAREITRELETDFGDALRSVLLFGSIARGEAIDGVSNVNLLVLLDDVNTARLGKAAGHAERWRKANAVPLLLEASEWQRAADVFAIELADMHDAHEVLSGTDPIAEHTVAPRALRLQAERELRGKILQLRSGLLAAAGASDRIGALLVAALPSFATYLRAALRLAGRPVPPHMDQVLSAGARLVGAEPAGLLAAHAARIERKPWKVSLDDAVVETYHTAAERTAAYLDAFKE